MTIEEWRGKLEEKAKKGAKKNKKRYKKINSKVIYGTTAEERFKEIHGVTIEEWNAKNEEEFITKTGMSYDEWYIKQVNSLTPIDYLENCNGAVSQDDVELVKDLQKLGLNDGVINVLLDYVNIFNKIGFIHSLVREMGESWLKKNVLTIESAIAFVREECKN
ncbi:DnaD domain protein [Lysinibacillus sp. UBA5990]|uniref:DnaD domain protein n=1 Tax=Lysinibacillus sp. UBA5990 TaxID=1946773 RepID=UPI0025C011CD|nr:DnaD domain protein [Lysinibacillus sp. UBA5990]